MSLLEVLKFPDPRLRNKGVPVGTVAEEHKVLAENMLETMYAEKGIGLAAIQVGVSVRLLVIDTRPKDSEAGVEPSADASGISSEDEETFVDEMASAKERYDLSDGPTELEQKVNQPIVIYNPEIVDKKGKTTFQEGCLSVPGYFETVQRHEYIEVNGLDREGKPLNLKLDGLLSICMQHEIDHLDGKVFIDRLSPIKSNRLKSKIKKLGYPEKKENG